MYFELGSNVTSGVATSLTTVMTLTETGLGIGTVSPSEKLDVVGNAEISGDLAVDTNTLVVNSTLNRVGINEASPDSALHVTGSIKVEKPFAGGGREGFVTLSNATTDLWDLSVDADNSNSFYLWDTVNSRYPFAVVPGSLDATLVVANSGRVGINTTGPSAALDVVGTAEISGDLAVDVNTLFVDSTNNRVGIGTTSPSAKLDVSGNVSATAPFLVNKDSAGAIGLLRIVDNGANVGQLAATVDGLGGPSDWQFQSSINDIHFVNTGNVGIGTTSPSAKLDVIGNAEISGDFAVDTNTLVVDSTNNRVGVRTTSPNAPLHVTGPARVQNALSGREGFFEMYSGSGAGTALWTHSIDSTDSNSFYLWDEQNSRYHFAVKPGTTASGTLVVDGANGRVGIGTTSPSAALDVVGTAELNGTITGFAGGVTWRSWSSSDTDIDALIPGSNFGSIIEGRSSSHTVLGIRENDGDDGFYIISGGAVSGNTYNDNNTYDTMVAGFKSNGSIITPNVTTTALAANARIAPVGGEMLRSTSSIRYKTDVEDAIDTLSESVVYDSRPVWYRSLADADNKDWSFWGFIAEELHEVDPRLVDYAEDENGELIPDGVQYERFVVHLVNVAQEQKKTIDAQQEEINNMKKMMELMEQRLKLLEDK